MSIQEILAKHKDDIIVHKPAVVEQVKEQGPQVTDTDHKAAPIMDLPVPDSLYQFLEVDKGSITEQEKMYIKAIHEYVCKHSDSSDGAELLRKMERESNRGLDGDRIISLYKYVKIRDNILNNLHETKDSDSRQSEQDTDRDSSRSADGGTERE